METIFFNGSEMHTNAKNPITGSQAPDFALVGKDLSEIALHDYRGRRLVLNIFPSLDTDVCAASVRRFNADAAKLDNTTVLCVSKDLPFAAARFCVANGIDNVLTASAFRSDFGQAYGMEIVDGPLRGLCPGPGGDQRGRRDNRHFALPRAHRRTRLRLRTPFALTQIISLPPI